MKKNVVISGGSRGIGAACAKAAASKGWGVCINYANNAGAAEQVAAEIAAAGGDAITVQADVRDESSVTSMFARCRDELGSVDGLVNNAGIIGRASRLVDASTETLKEVVDINLLGALLCAREALTVMTRGGSIVNVSSGAATLGSANEFVWYAATKGAMDSLTIGLAKECGEDGIRVNAVSPGLIETDIHDSSGVENRIAKFVSGVPLGRSGQPAEVADAVIWLLSEEASYISGANIRIGGGR